MNEKEMLELLMLSVVVLPNMDPREHDVKSAVARQLELFKKATAPYSLYQEVEEIESITSTND